MPPQTPQPRPAYVLGVGMTKLIKPRGKVDYPELGYDAGIKALGRTDQLLRCECRRRMLRIRRFCLWPTSLLSTGDDWNTHMECEQ